MIGFCNVALLAQNDTQMDDAVYSEQVKKKSPEERAQLRTDKLSESLMLSEGQKSEIYQILLNAENDRMSMKEQKRAERLSKLKEVDAKILDVLDEDQSVKYNEIKDERRKKFKKRRKMKRKGGE